MASEFRGKKRSEREVFFPRSSACIHVFVYIFLYSFFQWLKAFPSYHFPPVPIFFLPLSLSTFLILLLLRRRLFYFPPSHLPLSEKEEIGV